MRRVLVTGSNGFIGTKLLNRLRQDPTLEVRIFDRREHSLLKKQSLLKLVDNCDTIFHLAVINDPQAIDIFQVNCLGIYNLLDALREVSPTCKVIFPSSFSVYRLPEKKEIIGEQFEIQPRNKLGLSKVVAEQIVQYYSSRERISSMILRLSNVYGPGANPAYSAIASFIKSIKEDRPLTIYGDGTQTRDFIYVDDVVEAFMLASATKISNQTVNICSGRQVSLLELISLLEKISEVKPRIIFKEPNISGGGFWQGDRALAGKLLSWKPKVRLEDGLRLSWNDK